jgi:hypothetical protein
MNSYHRLEGEEGKKGGTDEGVLSTHSKRRRRAAAMAPGAMRWVLRAAAASLARAAGVGAGVVGAGVGACDAGGVPRADVLVEG